MEVATERYIGSIKKLIGKHAGEDIYVCGTGTSLKGFDWTRLNGKTVIALNDAGNIDGFIPTYHLFCDDTLYERYVNPQPGIIIVVPSNTYHHLEPRDNQFATFTHLVYKDFANKRAAYDPRWPKPYGHVVLAKPDVPVDDDTLYCGSTVAVSGIQLAYKLGAKRILLVGMDAYQLPTEDYWDGRIGEPKSRRKGRTVEIGLGKQMTHKHYSWDIEMHGLRDWFIKIGFFDEGRIVLNCNEESTLTAWPIVPLEIGLQGD